MAQDAAVMSAALRAFEADRNRRQEELDRRTQEVFRRLPRVAEIDRELRGTVAKIMVSAFDRDTDPEPALRALEQHNLALQRERAELLVGAGYPYDYIDEKVQCQLCQDRGFLRDGSPCRCLMAYYTREQNRRLSKLLDLEASPSTPSPSTGTAPTSGRSTAAAPGRTWRSSTSCAPTMPTTSPPRVPTC